MMLLPIKWLVASTLGALLAYKRDGYWFSVMFGAIANAVGVKLLKRLFNLPRPSSKKLDPGMPSSHAHMLSYFAAFAWLSDDGAFPGQQFVALGLLCLALAVCGNRISRQIHTLEQCAVGLCTGATGAFVWLEFVHGHVLTWVPASEERETPVIVLLACSAIVGAALLGALGRRISGEKH